MILISYGDKVYGKFDLVLNIGYKRKGDGVGSRKGMGCLPKQVMSVGDGRRGRERGADSRARNEKRRATENSLITGMT